jgi:hypothetical protein
LRNASFAAYVSNLTRHDNSIWGPIKHKKKPRTPLPHIRKYSRPPGPWTKRDKGKADFFAEHLSEVFTPHNNDQDHEVGQALATHTQPPESLPVFTLREIQNEIRILNPHRAPGIDLITAQMLKELPHEELLHLMHMFNAILRLDYWPTSLKRAKIIMIPKPGKNPTDVSSYRPLSLLLIISKVLEKLILKRLNKDMNPRTGSRTTNLASGRRTPQSNNAIA